MELQEVVGASLLLLELFVDSAPVLLQLSCEKVPDFGLRILELGDDAFQKVIMAPLHDHALLLRQVLSARALLSQVVRHSILGKKLQA